MRHVRAWAALALLTAGATSVWGAEPESPGLFQRLFGSEEEPQVAPTPPPPGPPVNPRDQASQVLETARDEWVRRMLVCDRFRMIALQNNDERMLAEIDALEQQATQLYHQKIAHLPVARLQPVESRDVLDDRLGGGVAVNPLQSGAGVGLDPTSRAENSIRSLPGRGNP